MIGHPERSLPRFSRQTESKDLHLFFNELLTQDTRTSCIDPVLYQGTSLLVPKKAGIRGVLQVAEKLNGRGFVTGARL
jgi:hypothetical protein